MICLATARPTAYDQQAGRLTDLICVSCTFFVRDLQQFAPKKFMFEKAVATFMWKTFLSESGEDEWKAKKLRTFSAKVWKEQKAARWCQM